VTPGQLVNRLLFPLRLRVIRLPKDYLDLRLYPEATRPQEPRYLNIGALDFEHPLWHRLDNPTDFGAFARRQRTIDIRHDLMSGRPLPLPDTTLSIAYCSHVIEHLRDTDVELLFREVYRSLKPGGLFRLVAPNARLFYEAYGRGDQEMFRNGLTLYAAPSIEQKFLMQFATSLVESHPSRNHRKCTDQEVHHVYHAASMEDFFDYFVQMIPVEIQSRYPADHINWFSPERAMTFLRSSGFTRVEPSAFCQSRLAVLRNRHLFDPHPDHSVYIECTK
jgi:predicted SAM-dependent methyltransferase